MERMGNNFNNMDGLPPSMAKAGDQLKMDLKVEDTKDKAGRTKEMIIKEFGVGFTAIPFLNLVNGNWYVRGETVEEWKETLDNLYKNENKPDDYMKGQR